MGSFLVTIFTSSFVFILIIFFLLSVSLLFMISGRLIEASQLKAFYKFLRYVYQEYINFQKQSSRGVL